jgi:cyanophycin synthetase
VLCDGLLKMPVMPVAQIPLTFGGTASCMTENVLPAVLTGYVRGLTLEQIRPGPLVVRAVAAPDAGPPQRVPVRGLPGGGGLRAQPAGMMALGTFVVQQPATRKVGIIAGIGDRKEEDTIHSGGWPGKSSTTSSSGWTRTCAASRPRRWWTCSGGALRWPAGASSSR